ncbi:MAG: hypothetical protein H6719_00430 [Sandaracinaceae bacterium]|nr:hypothetical protein [Sandaracinaceae bacterium]
MKKKLWLGWLMLLAGCGGETGTLDVSISGEEAATMGYPVGDIGFVDGWSLQFSTLVVNVGGFELRGEDGESVAADGDVMIDLHQGDAVVHRLEAVGARRWDDVRYELRPATGGSRVVGVVDEAVRRRMIDSGWSVYIEATAEKGGVTRTLAWGLDQHVLSRECVAGDGTLGVVVPAGAIADGQITFHWDHLFFDSLALDDADMRFDAMSAVADPEGAVTLEALNGQRLADLRDADGAPLVDDEGAPVVYDPGSEPLPEPTLRYHVLAVATTIGHWNGEGHCHYDVVP